MSTSAALPEVTGHDADLLIGDVARLSGLSIDTLRYYDRAGLLGAVHRDGGGRRVFDRDTLGLLDVVLRLAETLAVFARSDGCVAVQTQVNVFGWTAATLDVAQAHGLAVLARSPLAMGMPSGKYDTSNRPQAGDVLQLDDARVEVLRELDIPFALIGCTRDVTGLHYVDIDFDASVQMAMDHLAELGHHRIVLVNGSQEDEGFASYGPYVRSEIAYRELCTQRAIEPVVLRCRQTVRSGRDAAMELVATAPNTTAVLIVDEAAAAGLVSELARMGLAVPGDISVMSIFSSPDMAAICNPPLTTVTAPGTELGRLGVEALLRQLDGGPPLTPVLRAGVLALGESTGPIHEKAGLQ